MAQAVTLAGASVRIYINNKLYSPAQSVKWVINRGETPIYGIDIMYPQEIAHTRVSVNGSISGLVIKNSGDLQAYKAIPLLKQLLYAPYISLRINDRHTNEDILYIARCKIDNTAYNAVSKGTVKLNFEFSGVLPLQTLDFMS